MVVGTGFGYRECHLVVMFNDMKYGVVTIVLLHVLIAMR